MWFLIVAFVIAIALLITIRWPLWGYFASGLCTGTIGLKIGMLSASGRWPTIPEWITLGVLSTLFFLIMERKRRARIKAHPLYPLLEALESYQGDLDRLAAALQELAGEPEAPAEDPQETDRL